jgi:dihydroorotate dehydrogenase
MSLVAVGGISTGRDVVDAVAAGATLTQVYTAFIYRGPGPRRRTHAARCSTS